MPETDIQDNASLHRTDAKPRTPSAGCRPRRRSQRVGWLSQGRSTPGKARWVRAKPNVEIKKLAVIDWPKCVPAGRARQR